MELRYERRFERDLRRIRDASLLRRVEQAIGNLQAASVVDDVRGLAPLSGSVVHYRIRIGDYRLGIKVEGETVIVVRFRHRRDFYRGFP